MSGPRRGDTIQKEVVPAGREGGPASGQRPWPRGPRPGWQRTSRIAGHSPFPRLSALCHVRARSPRESGRFRARTAGLSPKVAETGDVEAEMRRGRGTGGGAGRQRRTSRGEVPAGAQDARPPAAEMEAPAGNGPLTPTEWARFLFLVPGSRVPRGVWFLWLSRG